MDLVETLELATGSEAKDIKMSKSFYIEAVSPTGQVVAVISGIGKNKGTWDAACYTLSTAKRWLRNMRAEFPSRLFQIGTNVAGETWA